MGPKGHPPEDPDTEVKRLDWFEEVREKALKQQGSGSMMTRWRGQLGKKADRELQQKALERGVQL